MTIRNYEYQSDFARKYFQQGREEGREEGAIEAKAKAVLDVLETRGLAVPDEVRRRVLATKDLSTLDRWHRSAVLVSSASALFDDVS
ncbi:hypothetical protein [Polyangium spumosum]|uniref:Uncharacterized protein n=1 Tax=Polyangium spumosum TaxID=889282 RepID=A0A6N7PT07_9BACT|nr:hypothetical protein [Polyangium spumosum]MRG95059.1 hypothetical protein [Polyangium spumosum]